MTLYRNEINGFVTKCDEGRGVIFTVFQKRLVSPHYISCQMRTDYATSAIFGPLESLKHWYCRLEKYR